MNPSTCKKGIGRASAARWKKREIVTHVEEHVLVLNEKFGEEAEVLAVELCEPLISFFLDEMREAKSRNGNSLRTFAVAPSTSQMLMAPR
jgi:hypothetical protein